MREKPIKRIQGIGFPFYSFNSLTETSYDSSQWVFQFLFLRFPAQCKKALTLDQTNEIPASSAAVIDSLSRIEPPGAITANTPSFTAASIESR